MLSLPRSSCRLHSPRWRSQQPLGARQHARQALIFRACESKCPRECFKASLDLVMIGAAVHHFDVHVRQRTAAECFEEIVYQLGLQIAHDAYPDLRVDGEGASPAQVERPMPREQVQHVIEESDPRRNVVLTLSVNAQFEMNLRLCSVAVENGFSHRSSPTPNSRKTSCIELRRKSVCVAVPAVIRTHPSHP